MRRFTVLKRRARKNKSNSIPLVIRKALVFERALHNWRPWLDSIAYGRKVLALGQSYPSLEEMRKIAQETLSNLKFPQCTMLELYWLCCVFARYETKMGFKFEELVIPDWFPLPFGFRNEEYLLAKPASPSTYWRKARRELFYKESRLIRPGRRIMPPTVWNEADKRFWFAGNVIAQCSPPERRAEYFQNYPDSEFILVLPSDHPVRQFVRHGRPRKALPNGEVVFPPKVICEPTAVEQYDAYKGVPIAPKTCTRCGGTILIWENEDKAFKCLFCGRLATHYATTSNMN